MLDAQAQGPETSVPLSVADADRAYAQLASEKGFPAASVQYFSEAGITFSPRATRGKPYWASQKNWQGELLWLPAFATAARAADLAYTTGPWELKRDGKPSAFGHYVTLWSKEPYGGWKVALDIGIDHSEPTEPPPTLQLMGADATARKPPSKDLGRTLLKAERLFLEASRQDSGAAILASAAEQVRVLRENALPAVGIASARLLLEAEHGKLTHEYGGGRLSSSGDLSYSYGNYSAEKGNLTERGVYLDIWRINGEGDWHLVLDLLKKLPDS